MTVGPTELFLILGAALLLFGPNRLPELARSLGQATRQYQMGLKEVKRDLMAEASDLTKPLSEEDELIATAKSLNIPTEGRSIEEIAEDILAKQSQ